MPDADNRGAIEEVFLKRLATEMRANSERWFPELHASVQSLKVFYALGLSGEVGEVANEVKKGIRGHQENGVRHIEVGPELADVFTYLLLLADEYDVDLIAEYQKKAAFNEARWGLAERLGADHVETHESHAAAVRSAQERLAVLHREPK
jgi:NTP pyrophosphatase (non-canonical NTP hydrolase)